MKVNVVFPKSQREAARLYSWLYIFQGDTKYSMLLGGLAACSSNEFAYYAQYFKKYKSLPCKVCPNGNNKVCFSAKTCREVFQTLNNLDWWE